MHQFNALNLQSNEENRVFIKDDYRKKLTRMSEGGFFMNYKYDLRDQRGRFNFSASLNLFVLVQENQDGVP